MLKDMAASFEVIAVTQLKNDRDLEPIKWNNVSQTRAVHLKTPHRYQQSPVFTRKANSSSGGENHERRRHRHHSAHHNTHKKHPNDPSKDNARRRRRGNSEGDKANVTPEEKVHLLSELPWRKSGDFSNASLGHDKEPSVPSVPRANVPSVSPSLPRRYADSPVFQRGRTWTIPTEKPSILARRGKHRAKSQDFSPPSKEKYLHLPLDILQSKMGYTASMVVELVSLGDVKSPQTPDTPLADSNGFLKVPDSVQRFLGLDAGQSSSTGLSEEDVRNSSRLRVRRGSSSSGSSTSTLT